MSRSDPFELVMPAGRGSDRPDPPADRWWRWSPGNCPELRAWLDSAYAAGFDRLSIRDDAIPGSWTATVSGSGRVRRYDLGQYDMGWLWDNWPEQLREPEPEGAAETTGWLVEAKERP